MDRCGYCGEELNPNAHFCPNCGRPRAEAVPEAAPEAPLAEAEYEIEEAEYVIEEAEDVLELWNNGTPNIVTFPDEPRSIMAKRTVSHRRWIAQSK